MDIITHNRKNVNYFHIFFPQGIHALFNNFTVSTVMSSSAAPR